MVWPEFSPREHREMLDRRWMIEHEERRDREMRDGESKRDQEMRDREDRRDAEAKERHRDGLVVVGAVLGCLTIIAAMIEAGWFGL